MQSFPYQFRWAAFCSDPNINSAFDYADFLINADGDLSNDREHSFKVNGSYTVQDSPLANMTVGLAAYRRSGTPLTPYGYSFAYSNWEYYLTPRGSLGRGPSDNEANLHVSYPIKVGSRSRINGIADIFNLFNRQGVLTYNQNVDRSVGNLNPDYGVRTLLQTPFQMRLGVRFQF